MLAGRVDFLRAQPQSSQFQKTYAGFSRIDSPSFHRAAVIAVPEGVRRPPAALAFIALASRSHRSSRRREAGNDLDRAKQEATPQSSQFQKA